MAKAKRHNGEIGVTASSNGRAITLAPIRELELRVKAREVESTLPCGFRAEWVSGKDGNGNEFDLCVGAGAGSKWRTFNFGGKQYCFDVEDLIHGFITAIEGK